MRCFGEEINDLKDEMRVYKNEMIECADDDDCGVCYDDECCVEI